MCVDSAAPPVKKRAAAGGNIPASHGKNECGEYIELAQITGGVGESTETDPTTGETVVRDCTGREIGRHYSMGEMLP